MTESQESPTIRNPLTVHELWYETLIDDCCNIATETEFASKWALVEGRHQLGARILLEYDKFERLRMPDAELVKGIALSIKRSKRTVYHSIQFARLFPDLALLPEGKDVSWSHVVNKYLSEGKTKAVVKKADLYRMITEIKALLVTEYAIANQTRITQSQAQADYTASGNDNKGEDVCLFIRHLQDQIAKITQGVEE